MDRTQARSYLLRTIKKHGRLHGRRPEPTRPHDNRHHLSAESLKEFIDHQLATKGYGNVSEYFRSLLRDAQKEEAKARLEALLLEGLAGGADIPLTPEFWKDLKAEARGIATKHNARKRP
jgi:antitoxin ParD1/3/4